MYEPIETANKTQIIPSDKGFYAFTVGSVWSDSCKLLYFFVEDKTYQLTKKKLISLKEEK